MALIERQQQQEQQQRLAQKRRQGPEGDPCRVAKKPAGEERGEARGSCGGCVTDTALLCSTVGFELKSLGSGSPRTRHRRPLFDNFVPEKQKKEKGRERERRRGEGKRKKETLQSLCVS